MAALPRSAFPNMGAFAVQMALQKRLRGLGGMFPMGAGFAPGGGTPFPPGRFPPVVPLPPVGGIRNPIHGARLPGEVPRYQPMARY